MVPSQEVVVLVCLGVQEPLPPVRVLPLLVRLPYRRAPPRPESLRLPRCRLRQKPPQLRRLCGGIVVEIGIYIVYPYDIVHVVLAVDIVAVTLVRELNRCHLLY